MRPARGISSVWTGSTKGQLPGFHKGRYCLPGAGHHGPRVGFFFAANDFTRGTSPSRRCGKMGRVAIRESRHKPGDISRIMAAERPPNYIIGFGRDGSGYASNDSRPWRSSSPRRRERSSRSAPQDGQKKPKKRDPVGFNSAPQKRLEKHGRIMVPVFLAASQPQPIKLTGLAREIRARTLAPRAIFARKVVSSHKGAKTF